MQESKLNFHQMEICSQKDCSLKTDHSKRKYLDNKVASGMVFSVGIRSREGEARVGMAVRKYFHHGHHCGPIPCMTRNLVFNFQRMADSLPLTIPREDGQHYWMRQQEQQI